MNKLEALERERAEALVIPERRISVGDQMDRGMDKLRTVYAALSGDAFDIRDIISYAAALDAAILDLEPVRNRLQGDEYVRGRAKS